TDASPGRVNARRTRQPPWGRPMINEIIQGDERDTCNHVRTYTTTKCGIAYRARAPGRRSAHSSLGMGKPPTRPTGRAGRGEGAQVDRITRNDKVREMRDA